MRPIKAYEIIDHGVHSSQSFQGCGTALTVFLEVATGAGYDKQEAYEDALDNLAQMGWEVTAIVEDLARRHKDDTIVELYDAEDDLEGEDTLIMDEDPLLHYVSIRVR